MSNRYECTKCGETCTSKDPARRNVFPSDMVAALMTNITNVMIHRDDPDSRRRVVIEFTTVDTDPNLSDDELEMEAVGLLRELSDDTVKHWLCNHKWKKTSGDYVVPELEVT